MCGGDQDGKRGAFTEKPYTITNTIGAFIIRIGFWDPFYYNYNKERPKIVLVIL